MQCGTCPNCARKCFIIIYLLLCKTNSHISGPPFSGPKSKFFIPGEKAEIQIVRLIIVPSYCICENYLQLWWAKGQYRLQLLWVKSIHSYNKTCKGKKYFHSLEELFSLFLCEPCWKWSFPIFGYCKHEWLIFTLPLLMWNPSSSSKLCAMLSAADKFDWNLSTM